LAVKPVTNLFQTPPADKISSREETMDQIDFLQMLMAQLRAQDPMNPLQGHEYAAQLAQFSSVQQLEAIQGSLEESINMNMMMTQSINGNLAAALVGKTVRAQNNSVSLASGGDADLRYTLSGSATDIEVSVLDSEGNVVRTLTGNSHEAGDAATYWDGRDDNGNRVPAGNYTFEVSAKNDSGDTINATTYVEGIVSAVNYADGQVTLTVNGQDLFLGDILSVMSAGSSSTSSEGSNTSLRG